MQDFIFLYIELTALLLLFHHFRFRLNILTVFYVFVTIHLFVSYGVLFWDPAAFPFKTSAIIPYAQKAVTMLAVGTLASVIGVIFGQTIANRGVRVVLSMVRTSQESRNLALLLILLIGCGLIGYSLSVTGVIPLFSDNLLMSRYGGEEMLSPAMRQVEVLLKIGLDCASVVLTFTLFSLFARRRYCSRFLGIVGAIASAIGCILIYRRSYLFWSSAVAVISLGDVEKVDVRRYLVKYGWVSVLFVVLFLGSIELMVPNIELPDLIYSTVPEVGSFAWILATAEREPLYMGQTYVADALPIPAFLSSFRQTTALPAVTKRLIGLGDDNRFGGLRIFMIGEAYLNFGWLGVFLIPFSWGLVMAGIFDYLAIVGRTESSGLLSLTGAYFFVFAGILFYLSGSGAINEVLIKIPLVAYLFRMRFVLP
jgi:hypothetical protein